MDNLDKELNTEVGKTVSEISKDSSLAAPDKMEVSNNLTTSNADTQTEAQPEPDKQQEATGASGTEEAEQESQPEQDKQQEATGASGTEEAEQESQPEPDQQKESSNTNDSKGGDERKFKIVSMLMKVIQMTILLTKSLTFIFILLIFLLSILNVIILTGLAFLDTFNSESDTIIKDTINYKLLRYSQFFEEEKTRTYERKKIEYDPNTKKENITIEQRTVTTKYGEPYFFISIISSLLFLILVLYAIIIIVILLSFLLIAIFTIGKFTGYFSNTDIGDNKNDGSKFELKEILSFPLLSGLVVAGILIGFHYGFFTNIIKPNITKSKEAITTIDKEIKFGLTAIDGIKDSYGTEYENIKYKFDTKLYKELKSHCNIKNGYDNDKPPDENLIISYYKRYASFLKKVKEKEKDTSIQNFKVKQSVLMIILYTYVYNQIPATNPRALDLIDYYFFKNPQTFNEKISIREYNADDVNDLTYISLFLNTETIPIIPGQFYSSNVLQKSLEIDNDTINKIGNIIQKINENITNISDYRKLFRLITAYIITFFVLSLILLMLYLWIIMKFSNNSSTDITMIDISSNIYRKIGEILSNIWNYSK
jgi:hypothetical protein